MLGYSTEDVISMEQPTSMPGSNSTSRTELATMQPVESKEAALVLIPTLNEWTTRACLTIAGALVAVNCLFYFVGSYDHHSGG